MARTFISQPNQIFTSEAFDDTLLPGDGLQTGSVSLEGDLNAIRTQIRQILWAGVSGSWYDSVTAPSGSLSARGLNTINVDLTDLEQKRFLFRRQNLNLVNIATGSNFALLSVSLGTAPADFAVVSHPLLAATLLTGTLVAALSASEGSFGAFSIAQTSGSSVITPKNLVLVRDAWTGQQITGAIGRDVYGLLQVESGTLSGQSFNDTTRRSQISFVIESVVNGTSSLAAAAGALVGGRTITYNYVRRTALDDIPEDAYLSNTIFLDVAEAFSGNFATLSDITLDRAIDNQVGTATQDQNIAIRIAAGFSWTFLSGTQELWKLASSGSQGPALTVNVNNLNFSSSNPAAFQQGISVATGSTQIDLGVVPGTIQTLSGNNLILSGGSQLRLGDFFGTGSSIPFSTSSLDWSTFYTNFGTGASILGAFNLISSSLSGSLRRTRFTAGTTTGGTGIAANANVTFPTNLDAQLGSYVGRDFVKDLEIYLNGILLLPGNAVDQNDVYPGTAAATGDLKFPYKLKSGSQISMVRY